MTHAPAFTPALLQQHVRAIHAKHKKERVIGIQARSLWTGPSVLDIDGTPADVVQVLSPLHARDLITNREGSDRLLVLLTDLDGRELGTDVLCRLALRQVMIPDAWSLVVDAFKARDLDPRLLKHRWMASALLDAMPADGCPPVAAGVLDSETAWSLVLERRLGLHQARPDAAAVLDWLTSPANVEQYRGLPDDMRAGVRTWLCESAGSVAGVLLDVTTASVADALPLGLAVTALFDQRGIPFADVRDAVVRLEPYVGGRRLSAAEAVAWSTAATAVVRRSSDERRVRGWCERADALVAELGAGGSAWRSDLLPRAFEQRCERTAAAVEAALDQADRCGNAVAQAGDALIAEAEQTLDLLNAHQQAKSDGHRDRVERLTMAVRLVRWVFRGEQTLPGGFPVAARTYLADQSFADWARFAMRGTDPSPSVSSALSRLAALVRGRRQLQEDRFGELLESWLDANSGGVLCTERVVPDVLAPAAAAAPVLFLVLDGMSAAVFNELTTSILDEGWVAVVSDGTAASQPVVTPLPSVTEYCRASLLSGVLTRGSADVERASFGAHPLLRERSRGDRPPILFHKRDLGDAATGLASSVRTELLEPQRRIVAAVVNAVDDHLLKADQIRARWSLPDVPLLRSLLHAARDGKRLVVLTSDHGHVLESGSTPLAGGDADRWRPAGAPVVGGERQFRGPRVLAEGHVCVAATGEAVRYKSKKNGYHGGATAQEVVVPLAMFLPPDVNVPGFHESGIVPPQWWDAEVRESAAPVVAPVPSPASRKSATPPLLQIAEQERPEAPTTPARVTPVSLFDVLTASPVYQSQRALHARITIDDARAKAVIDYLVVRGGRATRGALASHLGIPPFRLAGYLAALRTLLNVDAYPVLSVEEASDTIELNVNLMRVQFEL